MSLILSGTNGLSDVDGTAATPAVRGTDTNTGIFFPAADTVAASVGGTEGLRLTSTGLGVGTTSPATRLEVRNDTSNAARLRVTSSATTAGQYRGYEFGNGSVFKGGLLQDQSTDMISIFTPIGGQSLNLTTEGNLGLGVTPSAWQATFKAIDFSTTASLAGSSGGANLFNNAYWNGSNYIYKTTAAAARYLQSSGEHYWYTAPSGTAGNAISFTQVLAIEGGKSLALENATSQTGTGITFPATQSASSNANTLDDYEEGTFTPTITGTTSGTVTTGSLLGTYTKIGNMVTVWVTIINPNATTIVGNWKIALPFTISMPNGSEYTGGAVTYTRNIPWNGGATYLSAWSNTGNAFTYLAWSYNNNPTTESYLVSGNVQASTLLSFTMSYRTS